MPGTGHWGSISPLRGTRGVRYGPAPLWFYTAVHRVAGPRPEAGILAAGLFLTGAVVLLSVVLARRSEAPPLVLGVSAVARRRLALRLRLEPAGLGQFAPRRLRRAHRRGARPTGRGPRRRRGAGRAAARPLRWGHTSWPCRFAVAGGAVLLTERRGWRDRLVAVGAGVLAAGWCCFRTLRALAPRGPAPMPVADGGASVDHLGRTVEALGGTVLPDRRAGAGLLLRRRLGPLHRGRARRGPPSRVVGPPVATVVGWARSSGSSSGAVRAASPGLRRVARLGLWTWGLHAAFLGLLALPPEPHYQQPVLWIPVAGWALAVATLWPGGGAGPGRSRPWRWGSGSGGSPSSARGWGGSATQGGTRGIHYGLALGAQRRALAEACAAHTPGIALEVQVVVFPREPALAGAAPSQSAGPPGGDLRPVLSAAAPPAGPWRRSGTRGPAHSWRRSAPGVPERGERFAFPGAIAAPGVDSSRESFLER